MASYKMWLMAAALTAAGLLPTTLLPQVSTQGFLNLPRSEVPGTLLSDPYSNDSIYLGRTTTVQYLNGWVIVGGEGPGSATIDGVNRDLHLRIYDISDPAQPIRRLPSDFGLPIGENEWYEGDVWYSGNYGSNAHGSFHVENFLGRPYIYVEEFGGIVQKTNINTTFDLSGKRVDRLGISTNRSGMSGRFNATLSWYEKDDVSFAPFEIKKEVLHEDGRYEKVILATIDHKGEFGGGNWHPIFLETYSSMCVVGPQQVTVWSFTVCNITTSQTSRRCQLRHNWLLHWMGASRVTGLISTVMGRVYMSLVLPIVR